MDVFLTVLIIIVGLIVTPLVAAGLALLVSGVILGILLFLGVGLWIDLSFGVFLTCMIAGIILAGLAMMESNSNGKDTSVPSIDKRS